MVNRADGQDPTHVMRMADVPADESGVDRIVEVSTPVPTVDRGLRIQARLFLIIYAVMTVVVVYRVVIDRILPLWAVLGFSIGLLIGIVLSRTKKLSWDETERLVIGTSDALGLVILAGYFSFVLFLRDSLVASWVQDADAVGVVVLSMTAGAMLSRVHFTIRGVRRVLRLAGSGPKGSAEW
jgi:small-conductance mechanosensitive channel